MIHCLKTWPKPFGMVLSGQKTFELRVNDRGFQPGDLLCLQEFDPFAKAYTGRELQRRISCIIDGAGPVKLPDGLVVLGMEDSRGLGDLAKELTRLVALLRQLGERLGIPMPFGEVEEDRLLRAVEELAALKGSA